MEKTCHVSARIRKDDGVDLSFEADVASPTEAAAFLREIMPALRAAADEGGEAKAPQAV